MNMNENTITNEIIGAAIEVHRTMGPGLLESVYEDCLAVELKMRNDFWTAETLRRGEKI